MRFETITYATSCRTTCYLSHEGSSKLRRLRPILCTPCTKLLSMPVVVLSSWRYGSRCWLLSENNSQRLHLSKSQLCHVVSRGVADMSIRFPRISLTPSTRSNSDRSGVSFSISSCHPHRWSPHMCYLNGDQHLCPIPYGISLRLRFVSYLRAYRETICSGGARYMIINSSWCTFLLLWRLSGVIFLEWPTNSWVLEQ